MEPNRLTEFDHRALGFNWVIRRFDVPSSVVIKSLICWWGMDWAVSMSWVRIFDRPSLF